MYINISKQQLILIQNCLINTKISKLNKIQKEEIEEIVGTIEDIVNLYDTNTDLDTIYDLEDGSLV